MRDTGPDTIVVSIGCFLSLVYLAGAVAAVTVIVHFVNKLW